MHLYCKFISSSVVLPGKVSINLYLSLLEICLFLEVSATHEICLLEVSATQFFLKLMKFAFLEVSSIHSISQRFCHILQRYCNFCSDIYFCNVIATFLIFAPFLHCNYWQNALSSPILFIAFIMQSFTMQFTTWFKFERYSGLHNYRVFLIKVLLLKVQWSS